MHPFRNCSNTSISRFSTISSIDPREVAPRAGRIRKRGHATLSRRGGNVCKHTPRRIRRIEQPVCLSCPARLGIPWKFRSTLFAVADGYPVLGMGWVLHGVPRCHCHSAVIASKATARTSCYFAMLIWLITVPPPNQFFSMPFSKLCGCQCQWAPS